MQSVNRAGAAAEPDIEVRRSARRTRTMTAYREGGAIVVCIPARMSRADERRLVPQLVAEVLAKEERHRAPRGTAELLERARELAETYLSPQAPVPPPRDVVWVSNQHQRWGSCTPDTRVIRLSDRLQVMPAWVVDYVILHELAHLVERNHTPRFWELLAAYPHLERARGYLEGFSDARRLP